MPANETLRHLDLKRLGLAWAQAHGYRVAAAEVSVPNLGVRLDAAAYRPPAGAARGNTLGTTAVFECKQSRADFFKDSRCAVCCCAERLAEARRTAARFMRKACAATCRRCAMAIRSFPSLTATAMKSRVTSHMTVWCEEMRTLAMRLHAQTKFAQLIRWKAANVHYLIAEEGIARPHELPFGMGALGKTRIGPRRNRRAGLARGKRSRADGSPAAHRHGRNQSRQRRDGRGNAGPMVERRDARSADYAEVTAEGAGAGLPNSNDHLAALIRLPHGRAAISATRFSFRW